MGMTWGKRGNAQPIGDRPGGKRVLKTVLLPDGREIEFEVWVIDSPNCDGPAPTGAQPKSPVGGYGRIPRRGS